MLTKAELQILKDRVQELNDLLKKAERNACSETDYSELEEIATDIVCGIPHTVLLADYYTRTNIINDIKELDEPYPSLDKVNDVMESVWDEADCLIDHDGISYLVDEVLAYMIRTNNE